MDFLKRCIFVFVALSSLITTFVAGSGSIQAQASNAPSQTTINEWQMMWEDPDKPLSIEEVSALSSTDGWFTVHADGEYPRVPEHVNSAWMKITLPELQYMRPTIAFGKLFGQNVKLFINNQLIYEYNRDYSYDLNEIIVPLSSNESFTELFIKLDKHDNRIGSQGEVYITEFDNAVRSFIRTDLIDVILGASLIFISFFMLVSVMFISRSFVPGWNSLFLVMLSIGLMILTYSSFMDKLFPELGQVSYYVFDIASTLLVPSIFFFFEKVFGSGVFGIITKFKKIQIIYTVICFIFIFLGMYSSSIKDIYSILGLIGFSLSVIVGNLLLIGSMIYHCRKGNKEAIILSFGFSIFALVGVAEILWYFLSNKMHMMFFWKISLLFFLASLIIILVRRVMQNYEQAIKYSRQIEIYNNELQRSEKIEMISQLAASIAHEVRNPLQVTRGFLQLIGQKNTGEKDRGYTNLAINELDRASEIITDFLTFAKPDLGEVKKMDVSLELHQIEAILAPLATMNGGAIKLSSEPDLFVDGSSSKFKQALINIIKNSIEAFNEQGIVDITATTDMVTKEVLIVIKDNGEGIDEADLKRLGEPYYSKKSKGTGLGLMVTYRIIEAMKGTINFNSEKGIGTEVVIKIPMYLKNLKADD